jgi:excisionase family DNA binding protein
MVNVERLLDKEVLRVGEAAKVLGISDETLRKWARRGLLPCWITPTGERRFAAVVVLKLRDQMEHPVVERVG